MTAGTTAVGHLRNGERDKQQPEYNGHRHLNVAIGVLQVHQQLDDMVAQSDPECNGADGKESGGGRFSRVKKGVRCYSELGVILKPLL